MTVHRIVRGDVEATFAPERGGALLSLRVGETDLVRPTPAGIEPDPRGPLETACFPLVPYANRIADGSFTFNEHAHQVPLNFGDHPHSLHGLGWNAAWDVAETADAELLLIHKHAGGSGWPWAYTARQHATLIPSGIELALSIENSADQPMPAGLGFHPYFVLNADMHLHFEAEGVWLASPDQLPERLDHVDALGAWSGGAPLKGTTLVDNCYVGWSGEAMVSDAQGRSMRLNATDARYLHVYRPPDLPFFCLEPVTHIPDAINRGAGMDVLAPGETLRMTMTISAD